MKTNINVLVIENSHDDFESFKQAFEYGKENNIPEDCDFCLSKQSKLFLADGIIRNEQKKAIISALDNEPSIQIIIIDVSLRHNDEHWLDFEENAGKLLTIEILNEKKETFKKNKTCVFFTSNLSDLCCLENFEEFRRHNSLAIDENWYFIHKPIFQDKDPEGLGICPRICSDFKRYEKQECDIVACFLYTLSDIYKKCFKK